MRIFTALTAAALVVTLSGCGTDTPSDNEPGADKTPSASAEVDPDGPVPGAGVGLEPDTDEWCAAVTPEQLTAVAGETTSVSRSGAGPGSCTAALDRSEFMITWGSQETDESLEEWADRVVTRQGSFEQSETTLANGQEAVVVQDEELEAVWVATRDGDRILTSWLMMVTADATYEEMADIGKSIVSVYVE